MVRVRNKSREAIPGRIRQADGTEVEVQFHTGYSTFPDGTVLLTAHPKLVMVVEKPVPKVSAAEPSKPRSTGRRKPTKKPDPETPSTQ